MKYKNVKIDSKVIYKGGDADEIVINAEEEVTVSNIDRINDKYNVLVVSGSGNESWINHKHLRKAKTITDLVKEEVEKIQDTNKYVLDGCENEKCNLARRLVVLPSTDVYTGHANKVLNSYVDNEISFGEMYSVWSALLFHSGNVSLEEYTDKTKVLLDHMIKNELTY